MFGNVYEEEWNKHAGVGAEFNTKLLELED